MDKPQAGDEKPALTVERALAPNGSVIYTITLNPITAAIVVGAAALDNTEPARWLISVIGDRIATVARGNRPPTDTPQKLN